MEFKTPTIEDKEEIDRCILADDTRRDIIRLVAKNGELTSSEICQNFQISPPAISQHLKVLKEI